MLFIPALLRKNSHEGGCGVDNSSSEVKITKELFVTNGSGKGNRVRRYALVIWEYDEIIAMVMPMVISRIVKRR